MEIIKKYSLSRQVFLYSFCCLLTFCVSNSAMQAQGWERIYSDDSQGSTAAVYKVAPTIDGGSIFAGSAYPIGQGYRDMQVTKVDVDGVVQWKKLFGYGGEEVAFDIKPTLDGGYILAGYQIANGFGGQYDFYVVKIDQAGNLIWENTYSKNARDLAYAITPTLDGGYLVTGFTESNGTSVYEDIYILKLNNTGIVEWEQTYTNPHNGRGYRALANANGTFTVMGIHWVSNTEKYGVIITLDAAGNILWSQLYGAPQEINEFFAGAPTLDGGFIAAGRSGSNPSSLFLVKTDSNGLEEWSTLLSQTEDYFTWDIMPTPDGGYILPISSGILDLTAAVKVDALGDEIWRRNFGENMEQARFNGVTITLDGNYLFAGTVRNDLTTPYNQGYLVKLNPDGNLYTNFLAGNVANDGNMTCTIDPIELGLENWILEAKGTQLFYGLTDSLGNYFINVDSGSYDLRLIPANNLWQPCQALHSVQVTTKDTITTDFPVQPLENCVYLTTDISTPFLRRCFDATYYVSYCNQGTIASTGTYLEIDFDEYLTVNSSTLPWDSQSGTTYTFLIGDLEVGECHDFQINVTVDCDSTIIGQTHCVEAHIYPDTICVPSGTLWDGSITTVGSTCDLDSLTFTIKNTGTSNMSSLQDYLVVEDNIIMKTGKFMLQVSEEYSFKLPANGSTYRLYAEQAPGYFPTTYLPTVAIEGCGINPITQTYSTGFVTTLPEDDVMDYVSIDCQQSIGSFDPNDKRAEPSGVDAAHYINVGDDLDYHIRFQNTGTDTAFTVVIRDTISEFLDIGTLLPGTSSHTYDLAIIGSTLKFTFNDILLVDSTTNEPGSHGFVKFKISQKDNLPLGTIINNSAAIYFDFNAPVITNETYHQIGDDFIQVLSSNPFVPAYPDLRISVQPNPFVSYADFILEGVPYGNKSFELYDGTGRLVRSAVFSDDAVYRFDGGGLATGVYFYRIVYDGMLIGNGKMISGY